MPSPNTDRAATVSYRAAVAVTEFFSQPSHRLLVLVALLAATWASPASSEVGHIIHQVAQSALLLALAVEVGGLARRRFGRVAAAAVVVPIFGVWCLLCGMWLLA